VNFWHELDLSDWMLYEREGDWYLPFRQYIRKFVEAKFEFPEDKPMPDNRSISYQPFCYGPGSYWNPRGRGIVMAAGGAFLPNAYVSLVRLRELGCKLPVQMWYIGEDEMNLTWLRLFNAIDGVTTQDATKAREQHRLADITGWTCKPYAIVLSKFEEVLFIDADNVPVKDPTYLFDAPEYKKTGAVFWPDRVRHGPDSALWRIFGVDYRDEPQHETGQILINKRKCWHALQIAMHCNEYHKFHYRHSHGDTATFRFAFHALNQPFTMIPHRLIEVPVEREVEDLETLKTTPYLREEGDIRAVFLQRDFNQGDSPREDKPAPRQGLGRTLRPHGRT